MNNAIVWSKNNCPACNTAKTLLVSKGFTIEERNIDSKLWSKEDLFNAIPSARSVPQIIINQELVGGLPELRKYFD